MYFKGGWPSCAGCGISWRQFGCVQTLYCTTLCICLWLPGVQLLWLHFVQSQLVCLLPVVTFKHYIYSFIHFGHGRLHWNSGQLHTLHCNVITKYDAIDIADPSSMQDMCQVWTLQSIWLTIESLWLSGRACKCGIWRSEVQFLLGTQNFFFVQGSWQDEEHLSLFLAQNLPPLFS